MSTDVKKSDAGLRPGSRLTGLIALLNVILLVGLLFAAFGRPLFSSGGVTVALINSTPGLMQDLVFEYPGGKLAVPKLEAGGQVAHSVSNLAEFDATLRFTDNQGHLFNEKVRVRPYGEMLVLLDVKPIFETSVEKTGDGKEETVVKASANKVVVARSYQRPGGENR